MSVTWELPPGACQICRRAIAEHTLEEARRCLELVVDRFCRLTGPKR